MWVPHDPWFQIKAVKDAPSEVVVPLSEEPPSLLAAVATSSVSVSSTVTSSSVYSTSSSSKALLTFSALTSSTNSVNLLSSNWNFSVNFSWLFA